MWVYYLQSPIFKANKLQNVRIIRSASEGNIEKVCKEPCPPDTSIPSCLDKLKRNQTRFQKDEACPIWLKSTADKLLYLATVGMTIAGVGLSLYHNIITYN